VSFFGFLRGAGSRKKQTLLHTPVYSPYVKITAAVVFGLFAHDSNFSQNRSCRGDFVQISRNPPRGFPIPLRGFKFNSGSWLFGKKYLPDSLFFSSTPNFRFWADSLFSALFGIRIF
jgi:hypothetical protein